ncbi:hypothetical protein M0R45_028451 [Rubus argutus]|uniref:Uncharacterized protein n=1 Tax=Rubus argutus TaxID=59490 RepID=A0AAW1W965_RUBAR
MEVKKTKALSLTFLLLFDSEFLCGQMIHLSPGLGGKELNQAPLNPERTIFGVQRLIGRKFNDSEVQRDIKFLPYKVVNKEGKPYIQVKVKGEDNVFSHEEISAKIDQHLHLSNNK